MSSNKKRIAICFFGQVRTFRVIREFYKTLKSDLYDIDFFISTWDDFKDKREFDFCVSKEFIKPDIIKFKNNTDRASYTIFRVNNLKSRYEIENNFIYDCVVWCRSELKLKEENFLNILADKAFNCGDYEINITSDINYSEGNAPYLPSDHIFLGSSLAFDLYSTGWKAFYKSTPSPLSDNTRLHGGHSFHAFSMLRNNLDVKVMSLPTQLLISKNKQREVD